MYKLIGWNKENKKMYSIEDDEFLNCGVEFDISDSLEKEQCEYERKNRDNIKITVLKEPERKPMTEEEKADFEISTARISFVLGDGTKEEWEATKKKWGRE